MVRTLIYMHSKRLIDALGVSSSSERDGKLS
jgi:hypothetical protein